MIIALFGATIGVLIGTGLDAACALSALPLRLSARPKRQSDPGRQQARRDLVVRERGSVGKLFPGSPSHIVRSEMIGERRGSAARLSFAVARVGDEDVCLARATANNVRTR